MSKILLLGASGYIGSYFHEELLRRGVDLVTLSRQEVDYCNFNQLRQYISQNLKGNVGFLINAAGYTGKPNVDICEVEKAETIEGNLLLPQIISILSAMEGFHWLQVGTGCIYDGDNGGSGYTEDDVPNFTFENQNCSFYSGVKAVAEKLVKDDPRCYIARLRIPFNNVDNPRNYITKLLSYERTYDNMNSLSHIDDYVNACIDLYEGKCPTGIYNITNEGSVRTREVVEMITEILKPNKNFIFFDNDEEFNRTVSTPRSNCVLDVGKIKRAGFPMRSVKDALRDTLENWK